MAVFDFSIANEGTAAAGVSGWLHVSVLAFPLVKIVMRTSCRCVRLVALTCFRFSASKNRNVGAAVAGVRPVTRTCFRFSACKICNAGAAGVSDLSQVPVFVFPLVKIVT